MAISPQFLDELRARVGLAAIIGRRVRLTRKGREHSGLCPFHKEKTPSFTVNEDKGFYHCFGCGAHGSAIDFVMQADGVAFPEAVERLAAEAGMQVPADSPEERERARVRDTLHAVMEAACVHFEKTLRMPEGKTALEYLRRRDLDDDTIARFRLGFSLNARGAVKGALAREGFSEELMVAAGLLIRPEDESRPPYDRFRNRVMFPITDRRGRVIAFGGRILGDGEPKYLNSPETPLFHKGRVLYGLAQAQARDKGDAGGRLVIAEGYMDVIALSRAGFTNVVAPLGTALTEDQITLLWRLAREPVLCFDGDAAGRRAAARAADRVLPLLRPGYGMRFAILPEGEDPDSLVGTGGAEAMTRVLDGAMALSDALWRMETGGRIPRIPEERAAVQKRLEDHARRIDDATVRAHYLGAFRDRLWAGVRDQGRRRGATAATALPMDAKAGTTVSSDPLRYFEQTLITIVINHPGIFHQVEDAFGSLEFRTPALDELRQALISILSGDDEPGPDPIKDKLRRRGLSETLDSLLADVFIRCNRHIGPEASMDNVMATWEQSIERIRRADFMDELNVHRETQDLSDEGLRRTNTLKRAELGEVDE
jgi:DNA primase